MVGPLRLSDVRKIFESATELPPDDRAAYLETTCGSAEVRRRVEAMLAASDQGDGWLGTITRVDLDELREPGAELAIPDRLGRYAIRRRIATGGMGAVYEGEQDEPQRVVAIKVMRRNLVQRSSRRRFREETQILARLQHPAIAQIFEAAVHRGDGDDLPYFVMEFVPGARSITRYARERALAVRDRIALFIRVCEGVHHGHQKGVVHRDLKPDNVLVDGAGDPKIIDFGVARATDADVAVTTMRTDVGQIVGTLQYMSPEQLEGDPRDLDTRSDVYALGVVLFELLTGETPQDIRGLSVAEALRLLRETRPARLSSIAPKLRGDLETIVKKTLERDRDRRYQSALELAQDLGRYLAGEAIAARPPSLRYQLRMTARRHRPAAIAATIAAIAIIAGLVAATVGFVRSERARAETARERDRALAAEAFLGSTLTAVAPNRPHEEVPFRAVLDAASEMIENGELADHPLTEVSVRGILVGAYENHALFDEAVVHREAIVELYTATLGPEARETLVASMQLVGTRHNQARWYEGREDAAETLAICRRVLAPDDPLILRAYASYARAAMTVEAWRMVLEAGIEFHGPDSGYVCWAGQVYGSVLASFGGEPKKGRPYQERAVEAFEQRDGGIAGGMRHFLSHTYIILGLFDEAEALLEPLMPDLVAARRDPETLSPWTEPDRLRLFHVNAIAGQGRLDEAAALARIDYERMRLVQGDHAWVTIALARALADALRDMGRLDEAMAIVLDDARFVEVSPREKARLPTCRAKVLLEAGRLERAEVEAREAIDRLADFEITSPETWLVAAEVLHARGALAEARANLDLAMRFYDEQCEPVHPDRARSRRLLGAIHAAQGDASAAEAALREALAVDLEWRGPDDRETAKSRLALGRFLAESARIDGARAELEEARRILAASPFDEGLWLPRVEDALAGRSANPSDG